MSTRAHVILVGLPGSGKSTVGGVAARLLGAPCHDIDDGLARRLGMSVAEIFAEFGEPHFRKLEGEAVRAALAGAPAVVVPGAGWAAQPGQLEAARNRGLVIYLETPVLTATRRVSAGEPRPLLVGDPLAAMRNLLAERHGYYQRADRTIPTDGRGIDAVAADVAASARQLGGW